MLSHRLHSLCCSLQGMLVSLMVLVALVMALLFRKPDEIAAMHYFMFVYAFVIVFIYVMGHLRIHI